MTSSRSTRTRKVVHIASIHSAFDTRIYYKECRSLSRHGYEVTLIAPDPGTSASLDGVTLVRLPRIPVVFRKKGLGLLSIGAWKCYKLAMKEEAELYHFHEPYLLMTGLGLKLRGRKVIYDSHEDMPRERLASTGNPTLRSRVFEKVLETFENLVAKRFDFIIAATPHIRDRFRRIGCKSADIKNYPILEEFDPHRVKVGDKQDQVCYVGGLSRARGLFEMIRAAELSRTKLVLAGPFESPSLLGEAKKLPGWQYVDYRGVLDRRGVAEVVEHSLAGLVLLHPVSMYRDDSLPIKMFEYMAAGVPVIASDFPLWRKIVSEAECGVCVDPLNAELIAKAISELKDPDTSVRLGMSGYRAVCERYSWRREEAELFKVYDEVLSS
jgi:glycosyltransferase involved in cell wall biosynthesis